jgi:hypothetical protein
MRIRSLAAAGILAAAALVAGPAIAQDADTPLDRAIQRVEALLQGLRAAPQSPEVKELVRQLEETAKDLAQAKSGRDSGNGGGAEPPPPPGGGGGAGGGGGGGMDWAFNNLMEGIDFTEQEKPVVRELLRVFYEDYLLARRAKDDGSKKTIKDDLEKRVERTVSKKKANALMVNVDTALKRMEWGGGRR